MYRLALATLTFFFASVASCQEQNPLKSALEAAFHVRFAVGTRSGGHTLGITVDTTPSDELALRVAQFARAHYDSIASIDAINMRFVHVEQTGIVRKTTVQRVGAYLPAMLPKDTTPGWTRALLTDPAPLVLSTGSLKAGADTVDIGGFTSTIVSIQDTTISGHALWRIGIGSRNADTVFVDRTTLLPVEERRTDLAGTVDVQYDGPHLIVTSYGASGPARTQAHDTTLAVAPYSAAELDILLEVLPLNQGYSARFPAFHANSVTNGLDWITILVTGVDTTKNAWIVDAAGTGTIGFSRRWIPRR